MHAMLSNDYKRKVSCMAAGAPAAFCRTSRRGFASPQSARSSYPWSYYAFVYSDCINDMILCALGFYFWPPDAKYSALIVVTRCLSVCLFADHTRFLILNLAVALYIFRECVYAESCYAFIQVASLTYFYADPTSGDVNPWLKLTSPDVA